MLILAVSRSAVAHCAHGSGRTLNKAVYANSTRTFFSSLFGKSTKRISHELPKNVRVAEVKEEVTTKVFFDVTIDGEPSGRITFGLFGTVVPKTAENFRSLCAGDQQLSYKGSPFHRIIPAFMCQGGDITHFNGTGGRSIYGDSFEDENFKLKHTGPGLLSMANAGPNTNNSQFFITTVSTPHLDGKHVVFGRVLSGMEVVRAVGALGSRPAGKPRAKILVADCGEVTQEEAEGTPAPE